MNTHSMLGMKFTIQMNDIVRTYTVVEANDSDSDPETISWQSPLAQQLLKTEVGDELDITFSKQQFHITVLDIAWWT